MRSMKNAKLFILWLKWSEAPFLLGPRPSEKGKWRCVCVCVGGGGGLVRTYIRGQRQRIVD